MKKTTVSFWVGFFAILLGGCRGQSKPDFGRWYRFDALADEKSQPQTGSQLVQKCPGPVNLPTTTFDAVKTSWLLSWTVSGVNCKLLGPHWNLFTEVCYRENLQPCTDQLWMQQVVHNANMAAVDSVQGRGVMRSHGCLRTLPTDYPCYMKKKGFDFFPLDRLQNSFLNAGTPVYISHYSKDRAWVMIMDVASMAAGFVKTSDVMRVDREKSVAQSKPLPIAVFFKGHEPLYDAKGQCVGYSRLGQVALVAAERENDMDILWPKQTDSKHSPWCTVRVSKTIASTKPLAFSSDNIAYVLNQLLGKPYGWGGTLGNRDCTSMIQDYFRVFGYALPRNSKAQMEKGGEIVDLSGKSRAEKEHLIMEKGIPYRTILWAPGHVTLYVGSDKGRVLMAHSTLSSGFIKDGYEGSHIIGKSIVSTLYYDVGIPGLQHSFIDQLGAMVLVQ